MCCWMGSSGSCCGALWKEALTVKEFLCGKEPLSATKLLVLIFEKTQPIVAVLLSLGAHKRMEEGV